MIINSNSRDFESDFTIKTCRQPLAVYTITSYPCIQPLAFYMITSYPCRQPLAVYTIISYPCIKPLAVYKFISYPCRHWLFFLDYFLQKTADFISFDYLRIWRDVTSCVTWLYVSVCISWFLWKKSMKNNQCLQGYDMIL